MIKPRRVLQYLKPYLPGQEIAGNIKLASNENPLGPSPKALSVVQKMDESLSLYPDGGCTLLREALSEKFELKSSQILAGNGSDEILLYLAAAFLDPGDEVLIPAPTFSVYETSARLFGASPSWIQMENGEWTLDSISRLVNSKTKIVYLCNPNNPTGTIFSKAMLVDFLGKISDRVVVVIDEAYHEYAVSPEYPQTVPLLQANPNVVVLRTFSKIYGLAGLRVGYALSSEPVIEALSKVKMPFNVNRVAQQAAVAALKDTEFVKKSQANNEAGKQYLYKELKSLGLNYLPTEANFIYIEVPLEAKIVFEKLVQKGITIRPLESFGCPRAIRVTIGTPEQNEAFVKALKQVL
jgi:histidinol-phosphate aminotransferase